MPKRYEGCVVLSPPTRKTISLPEACVGCPLESSLTSDKTASSVEATLLEEATRPPPPTVTAVYGTTILIEILALSLSSVGRHPIPATASLMR